MTPALKNSYFAEDLVLDVKIDVVINRREGWKTYMATRGKVLFLKLHVILKVFQECLKYACKDRRNHNTNYIFFL